MSQKYDNAINQEIKKLQGFKRALISWNGNWIHQVVKAILFNYFKTVGTLDVFME